MKISCRIIEDLLPLYADDVCSQDSRKLVNEHLVECPACLMKLKTMQDGADVKADIIISLIPSCASDINRLNAISH